MARSRHWTLALEAGGLLIALAVFALIWGVRSRGWLEPLELAGYDLTLRACHHDATTEPSVLIVGLTEDQIRRLGEYPLSDHLLATAIQNLENLHARVIGVDIYRDFPIPGRHASRPDELNQLLLTYNNIVWTWKAQEGEIFTSPPPVLLEHGRLGQVGFADTSADADGVLRHWLLMMSPGNQTNPALEKLRNSGVLYSLDYRIAMLALAAEGIKPRFTNAPPTFAEQLANRLGKKPDSPEKWLNLGGTICPKLHPGDGPYIAEVGGYQIPADYKTEHPFRTVDFDAVSEGKISPDLVKDKVILIGITTPSAKDLLMTPMGRQEYGVELHARCIDQLQRTALQGDRPTRFWPKWAENFWILAWCLAGAGLGVILRSPWRFALAAAAGLTILIFIAVQSLQHDWWIPVAPPGIAWLVSAAVVTSFASYKERQQRAAVTQLFERHVDKPVFDAIWSQRAELLDGGRLKPKRAIATVLFTDLRGFSATAEKLQPDALMTWLNEYMSAMSDAVAHHQGVVLKYIGDAVMATFGIPLISEDPVVHARDAGNAVAAALEMRAALAMLNAQWKSQGRPQVQMRVGIFTGPLVVGSLGSAQRLEYTCLGGTVNTASRLESYDKKLMDPDIAADGCRILISDSTYKLVKDQYRARTIGEVELAGISAMVPVYGVIGATEPKPAPTSAAVGGPYLK